MKPATVDKNGIQLLQNTPYVPEPSPFVEVQKAATSRRAKPGGPPPGSAAEFVCNSPYMAGNREADYKPRPRPCGPLDIWAVYSDGGIVGGSPSKIGGVFAWCYVNSAGERIADVLRRDAEERYPVYLELHERRRQLLAERIERNEAARLAGEEAEEIGETLEDLGDPDSFETFLQSEYPKIQRPSRDTRQFKEVSQRFHGSGFFDVRTVPPATVSGNVAELVAVVNALRYLPVNWSGDFYTDSLVTISRMSKLYDPCPVTRAEVRRKIVESIGRKGLDTLLCAKSKVGEINWIHVKGHPKPGDLERGATGKGVIVSPHNVWCDDECNRAKVRAGHG